MNKWMFSGEIVRYREFDTSKRFKATITIKGTVSNGGDMDSMPVEFSCMIPKNVFSRKIKLYKNINAYGHHETWSHITTGGNVKTSLSRIMDGFDM